MILQHGSKDHARSWDFAVRDLVDDYCIAVPDLRGHGDSGHVPGGGYDGVDFVADFAALVEDLEARGFTGPHRIVGHSLGGNVASHYAAAFPERVKCLINIEGVGFSQERYDMAMARAASERWRGVAVKRLEASGRTPRTFKTPDLAVRRMKQLHARVPAEIVEHVALHAINEIPEGFRWKYDQMLGMMPHRPESPAEYMGLYQAITCPVLMIYGTDSFATTPDRDGRGDVYPDGRLITYEGAGHWLHHERLADFVRDVRGFLAGTG